MIPLTCGINFCLFHRSLERGLLEIHDFTHTHLELSLSITKMTNEGIENSPLDYISDGKSERNEVGCANVISY
jgi:hypothetical protein